MDLPLQTAASAFQRFHIKYNGAGLNRASETGKGKVLRSTWYNLLPWFNDTSPPPSYRNLSIHCHASFYCRISTCGRYCLNLFGYWEHYWISQFSAPLHTALQVRARTPVGETDIMATFVSNLTVEPRSAVGHSQPPILGVSGALFLGVKRSVREVDYLPPLSIRLLCCVHLIKRKDKFTLLLLSTNGSVDLVHRP
jgi:hypothetical protein